MHRKYSETLKFTTRILRFYKVYISHTFTPILQHHCTPILHTLHASQLKLNIDMAQCETPGHKPGHKPGLEVSKILKSKFWLKSIQVLTLSQILRQSHCSVWWLTSKFRVKYFRELYIYITSCNSPRYYHTTGNCINTGILGPSSHVPPVGHHPTSNWLWHSLIMRHLHMLHTLSWDCRSALDIPCTR